MQRVDAQLAQDLNLPADHGALIVSVTPGSPADKAGLRGGRTGTSQGVAAGGDLIVAVDGKDMKNEDAVATAIAAHQPGDKVEITVLPRERQEDHHGQLDKRPANADTSGSGCGGGGGGGGNHPVVHEAAGVPAAE